MYNLQLKQWRYENVVYRDKKSFQILLFLYEYYFSFTNTTFPLPEKNLKKSQKISKKFKKSQKISKNLKKSQKISVVK